MAASFHLSCELVGHEEDVRGICVIGESLIATASRDRTVRLWKVVDLPEGGYSSELVSIFLGHTGFVSAVNWISPNEEFAQGALVSGGMDSSVIVWNIENASILHTLKGHEFQVTSLAISKFGEIISSSLDKTIRIWKYGACINILKGHQSSVLSVITLPSGDIVSGSADCTVKIWRNHSCIKTLKSHTDSVRGLSVVENFGFASASHDCTVKLWSESGDAVLELIGHSALVYCVSSFPFSGSSTSLSANAHSFCSGSEDNTAKIWQNGVCIQNIDHPGCIWATQFLTNGDIITACSDGVARIFSSNNSRTAPKDVLDNFELKIQDKLKKKSVGGMNLNELPSPESLNQPGKKNGETKIVREGNSAIAYSWNSLEFKWEKIGSVVDGPDNLNSKAIDGVSHDYVFDVDIGDGMPLRKLPYNNDQNPYDVAEKWLEKENLPYSYKEQVVAFIIQNSNKRNESVSNQYVDPYTGAQAYVPGASSSNYSSNISNQKSFKYLTKKEFYVFETAQFDGIQKKIIEFNDSFASNSELSSHALSDDDVLRIKAIISILKNSNSSDSSSFADVDFVLVKKIIDSWPPQSLFPLFDVLRLMALHSQATEIISQTSFLDDLFSVIKRNLILVPNQLTSLRLIVNFFQRKEFKQFLLNNKNEIFDVFEPFHGSENKNVRIAYSTLLYNFSILSIQENDEVGQIQAHSKLIQILTSKESESEVLFRSLYALGILVRFGSLKDLVAGDTNLLSFIQASAKSPAAKIKEISEDLISVLT